MSPIYYRQIEPIQSQRKMREKKGRVPRILFVFNIKACNGTLLPATTTTAIRYDNR